MSRRAPKVQNVTARPNGPGRRGGDQPALKARDDGLELFPNLTSIDLYAIVQDLAHFLAKQRDRIGLLNYGSYVSGQRSFDHLRAIAGHKYQRNIAVAAKR